MTLCNTLMAGLTAQDWEALCYHPTGLQPVRRFVDLYMTELAMHGWDIQSRVEPVAHLSAESLPIFLDLVPDMIRWTFRPGHHLSAPVRSRFVLTDRLAHAYDIVITGDQAWLTLAGTDTAHLTCQGDTETFVLLVCGRLPWHGAIAEGRMSMEGNRELMTAFARWFRGL